MHHGSQPAYLDCNYGEVLMLWDHPFGTFEREREPARFGLTEPQHSYNPLWIQLAGLAWLRRKMSSAASRSEALACLWRPPEWAPAPPVRTASPPPPRPRP